MCLIHACYNTALDSISFNMGLLLFLQSLFLLIFFSFSFSFFYLVMEDHVIYACDYVT